ncbi:hypothetical protein PAPYR_10946 [Paratrimastix pyriformis]|uniref:Uncharacterized protein n=1 Tax=Paratrimastix pyriformis TaxID=342808 RepID=A0ABQ8U9U9_9EUKA|nr:hypothetical protein PAPYR_10946 [Paratrimastix pyriformis]
MQYCGCSFVFDFFERLLVFTGASLQRCMREILIARAPMRRLFEVFDWFTTKTTRSGVAQSFTLSTKRFVLCELDTVILVRSFKAGLPSTALILGRSKCSFFFSSASFAQLPPFFLENMRVPSFSADYFANSKFSPAPVRAHLGHSSAMSGRQSTVGSPSGHSTGNSRKGYIFEPLWNSDVTRKASLPIALAQPAGFPSGFELRDGLLKARGTCLLGLGRVVLVTDHSDTVERSLCKSAPGPRWQVAGRELPPGTHQVTLNAVIFLLDMAHGLNSLIDNVLVPQNWYHRSSPNSRSTTTQPPSWETRRHGTRAPSGTDSLALEAMSEANSWGNYYQVVKSRGCTFPHCTVHAEGVHFL